MGILGWIVTVGLIIVILVIVFAWLNETAAKKNLAFVEGLKALGRKNTGADMMHCAYWFSESRGAMLAIKVLGQKIMENESGLYCVSNCRDEWRAQLKAALKEELENEKRWEATAPNYTKPPLEDNPTNERNGYLYWKDRALEAEKVLLETNERLVGAVNSAKGQQDLLAQIKAHVKGIVAE